MTAKASDDGLRARIAGPVHVVPTPFAADGAVDWEGLRRVVEIGVAGGAPITLLTAGSSLLPSLSDEELRAVTRAVVDQVAGRTLTVAATRPTSAPAAAAFAAACREMGVDVIMPTPWLIGDADAAGVVAFYEAVAAVMPTMIVGFPPHAALDRLVDNPGIVAFKEDGSNDYGIATAAKYAARLPMLSGGLLARHLALWPHGVRAGFCEYHSFAPWIGQAYWGALDRGDTETARAIAADVDLPFLAMDGQYTGGLHAVWHAALEIRGLASRHLRPPLVSLPADEMARLAAALDRLGLLSPPAGSAR
jgi:4-hydroxy-tetrahydrodipicolinate synthase